MPDSRSSSGWRATLGALERLLDRAARGDQRGQVVGDDPQSEPLGGDRRVDRAAVGHVDRDAGRLHVARDDERRHVAEGDRLDGPAARAHARDDATGGHVDRDVDLAVARRGDAPDSTAHAPSAIVPWPHAVE